jgi:non-ribosomal peptide synthetase component F
VFVVSPTECVFLLVVHHIAADGWSIAPLCQDLSEAYAARCAGRTPGWAAVPVQYVDYTLWQRELLGSEDDPESVISRQLRYWEAALAELPEQLELPAARPRPAAPSYRGGTARSMIGAELHQRLSDVARAHQVTLFMVLQAGLAVLLSRLSAGEDIPIGTPIAGRTDEALDDMVGFFVNTLVLRTDTSGDPTFADLLARVRETDLAAYAHQDVPFERLVEQLNPVRTLARHPLFQTMLILQNTHRSELRLARLDTRPEPLALTIAKFDLSFELTDMRESGAPDGLELLVHYADDVFDRGIAEIVAERFVRTLDEASRNPKNPISHVNILTERETHQLLHEWNDTHHPVPSTTVHDLIEAQSHRTPDAIAITTDTAQLTYAQLNHNANQLARLLREHGVGPDVPVAIWMDRGVELIVAILAVLKAGGAYVPIDPDVPRNRARQLIQAARVTVCLVGPRDRHHDAQELCATILPVDVERLGYLDHLPEPPDVRPDHAISLYYTSGWSTPIWGGSTGCCGCSADTGWVPMTPSCTRPCSALTIRLSKSSGR